MDDDRTRRSRQPRAAVNPSSTRFARFDGSRRVLAAARATLPTSEGSDRLDAVLLLRSPSGLSRDTPGVRVNLENIDLFKVPEGTVAAIRSRLEHYGFTVLASSRTAVSIYGPRRLFEEVFGTRVVMEVGVARRRDRGDPEKGLPRFSLPPAIPEDLAKHVEKVCLPKRAVLFSGEGAMPTPPYYHLRPPHDIARLLNAEVAHAVGYRGSGVKVALLDTGFFASHDYYNDSRGHPLYNITVHEPFDFGPPGADEGGHGTAISANLLAIAPLCDFHVYKCVELFDGGFVSYLSQALQLAMSAGARVIAISTGTRDRDDALADIITEAVAAGVVVVCACGNGRPMFPGTMAEVISVGGAYPLEGRDPRSSSGWEAASYAGSGVDAYNEDYSDRECPDFCGIVGHLPKGVLIAMPTMAGSHVDGDFGQVLGIIFQNSDETPVDDGWVVGSGTSSAAPMVAGAAALLIEKDPSMTPAEVKRVLAASCLDVVSGHTWEEMEGEGNVAVRGRDIATGTGVVDVGAALGLAERSIATPGCKGGPTEVRTRRGLPERDVSGTGLAGRVGARRIGLRGEYAGFPARGKWK